MWKLLALHTILAAISFTRLIHAGHPDRTRTDPIHFSIPQDRFPYVASVRRGKTHLCTGALVRSQWVAVAAHCIHHLYIKNITINIGVSDVEVRNVVSAVFPESYSGSLKHGNNIALLKLDTPSAALLIQLPQPWVELTGIEMLHGLGMGTVRVADEKEYELQGNGMVPSINCEDAWHMQMLPSMLCISARINETCKGEQSSGLLMFASSINGDVLIGQPQNDVLLGVQSVRQEPCENGTKPAIYSSIVYSRSWMEIIFDQDERKMEMEYPPPGAGPDSGVITSGAQGLAPSSQFLYPKPSKTMSFHWFAQKENQKGQPSQEPEVEDDNRSLDELDRL